MGFFGRKSIQYGEMFQQVYFDGGLLLTSLDVCHDKEASLNLFILNDQDLRKLRKISELPQSKFPLINIENTFHSATR